MRIGVPKEIKASEHRVSLTPAGAEALVQAGQEVVVESGSGLGSGFDDEAFRSAGAEIVGTAQEVWASADLVYKVKEPVESEWPLMRPGQVIFAYLHFAASEELTRAVIESGVIAIAYETVQLPGGELPLLTPMSEIAGRLSVQQGAKYLERIFGGRGVLLSGVPGVEPANVVVIGGGTVGSNAARIAAGLGARVVLLDISLQRLRHLSEVMPANVTLVHSNRQSIEAHLGEADLVIGAVLVPGARAPMVVRREDLGRMRPGAVIIDVAVDQGGCVETTRPTTHEDPVRIVDGIVHYGVSNMPGAVPRTATLALTNATLPYAMKLATKGWREASREDEALRAGLNVIDGVVTYQPVAEAFGLPYTPVEEVL